MQLIPQWKSFYKRWSTWLLASGGALSAAMSFMPTIQDYIAQDDYKMIMLGLSVATFLALHIKQDSVSGDAPK